MAVGETLGEYIEKWHVKRTDWKGNQELEVLGVSNVDGITTTSHIKSKDLSGYLVIEPETFAYNPYRINVGSIGLTPNNVFGIVSPAYVVFKVRERKLIPEFLLEFLKSFDGLQQINKYARGTVRKALRFDDLCKIQVSFPDYDEQKKIFKKKLLIEKKNNELEKEIQIQKHLTTQLKQSILQEAIQGKLTADWREQNPNTEPASELLKRIKAEKDQLIKDKKIKKIIALPPITDEEIPFEIPEGWVWCRLGEICHYITKGTTPAKNELLQSGDIPYLKVYNIVNQKIDFAYRPQFISRKVHKEKLTRSKVLPNDVLMNIVGPPLGKVAIVPDDYSEWNINQALAIYRPIIMEINQFIYYYLNGGLPFKSAITKGVVGQDNLSLKQSREVLFPLAPISEQKVILKKVETLMQKCTGLEQEIKASKANAQMLMQAVLKEAFEGKKEVVCQD